LDETRLIQASPPNGEPVISLSYAELHDVKLGHSGRLGGFDLQGIVLVDADLREADLSGAANWAELTCSEPI
jgi:uncharacterized protein YjbI with pentapeptide repeats